MPDRSEYPVQQHIRCPSCREYVLAFVTWPDGDPFPSHVHFCDCGYTIIESEWEPVGQDLRLPDYHCAPAPAPAPPRPRAWRVALALWVLAALGATIAALVLSRLLGAL